MQKTIWMNFKHEINNNIIKEDYALKQFWSQDASVTNPWTTRLEQQRIKNHKHFDVLGRSTISDYGVLFPLRLPTRKFWLRS